MGWDAADKSSYGPNMGTLVENAQKGAYNWQKSDCLSGIRGACDPLFLSQPSCSLNCRTTLRARDRRFRQV